MRIFILVCLCISLASCGSYMAVERVMAPYGVGCPFYEVTRGQAWSIFNESPNAYIDMHEFWPLLIVDLPFTALTETLLLPVDAIQTIGLGGRR